VIEEIRTAIGRRRWRAVEGKVIDKGHVKKILVRFDSSQVQVSIDEYVVEIPTAHGASKRLMLTAKSIHLPATGVSIGQSVPLHVNRRESKAVFGDFDTSGGSSARKRAAKQQREKDKARLESRLQGK
jgi:hypothetical protein